MRFLLSLLALCLASTAGEPGGTVVVLNKGAASATLIDRASGRTVATLATGRGPHEVAVSPDGKTAVVTNYGARQPGSTLTVFDLSAGRVARQIDLERYHRPHGIMFHPDGKRIVVTAEAEKALIVVDVASGKVLHAIDTGQNVGHMVALSPKAARAYVANIGSGSMTAIDLETNKRLKVVPTGRGAEGIAVSPDGREVWVTNRAAGSISVVNAAKLEVVATLKCAGFPIRTKFTPDGKHVLVSCAFAGELAVFDAKERKELRRIDLATDAAQKGNMFRRRGPLPIGILVPPDGSHAFVATGGYDQLVVIDLKTWKVTARHKTGREPDGVAYSKVAVAPVK